MHTQYLLFIFALASISGGFEFLPATIADIHEALLSGELTCDEVINGYMDRIDAFDDLFNGVNTINENAFIDAKALIEEHPDFDADTFIDKPLFCIPALIKDLIDVEGIPTTLGVTQLNENYPLGDATAVRKIKDAGGIVIGKGHTSEFASIMKYSSSAGGTPRSPWALDQYPLGSSCGNGIGGAAAYAPISIGTDTFVSVVGPASKNALFGLRPATKDRSSVSEENQEGVFPAYLYQDVVGPFSRDFEDMKTLTKVMGYEWRDEKGSEIRVGLPDIYFVKDVAEALPDFVPDIWNPDWDMVAEMAKILERLDGVGGITVKMATSNQEVVDAYGAALLASSPVYINCFKLDLAKYLGDRDPSNPIKTPQDLVDSGAYDTLTDVNAELAKSMTVDHLERDYTLADCEAAANKFLDARKRMADACASLFTDSNIDVLVTPTLAQVNVSMNIPITEINIGTSVGISVLSGWPALNIPVGFTEPNDEAAEGLPFGALLIAPPEELGKIMEVARVFQKEYNVPNVYPSLSPELNGVNSLASGIALQFSFALMSLYFI